MNGVAISPLSVNTGAIIASTITVSTITGYTSLTITNATFINSTINTLSMSTTALTASSIGAYSVSTSIGFHSTLTLNSLALASSNIALGYQSGNSSQGNYATAIGANAGQTSQGANAVAIGYLAGQTSQTAGSIALNASGVALNPTQAGFFVKPIRTDNTQTQAIAFNTTTNEVVQSRGVGIAISTITATSIAPDTTMFGMYYYITNSGFNAINLPASVPSNAGAFWLIRNNTGTYLSVGITNQTSFTTPQVIPPFNSLTIAVTGTGLSATGYYTF